MGPHSAKDILDPTRTIWTIVHRPGDLRIVTSIIAAISLGDHTVTQFPVDSDFDHRIEWAEDTLLVSLRGQLVYETLGPLQACWAAVRGRPRPTVVLDLSQVTFLASGPLGSLVALHRWLADRGHQLRVSALSSQAREVLRMTGLAQFFSIDDGASVVVA
jgi:anti-anti-sigma factor